MQQVNTLRIWWVGGGIDTTTGCTVLGGEGGTNLVAALASVSGVAIAQARQTMNIGGAGTPGTVTPLSAALFIFKSSTGTDVRVIVPQPVGVYASDSETVDPTLSASRTVISAVLANVADTGGNAIVSYSRGYKIDLSMPPLDGRMLP
jgi:hypothetical protein